MQLAARPANPNHTLVLCILVTRQIVETDVQVIQHAKPVTTTVLGNALFMIMIYHHPIVTLQRGGIIHYQQDGHIHTIAAGDAIITMGDGAMEDGVTADVGMDVDNEH